MATVNDLPTELLCKILEAVFSASPTLPYNYFDRLAYYHDAAQLFGGEETHFDALAISESSSTTTPRERVWNYEEFGNPALCPFTVSSVCRRWHDMLAYSPKFWTHIAFDVAHELQPWQFDAFAFSIDLPIMVYIFSSAANSIHVVKAQENARAAAIIRHIHQHMKRCASIVFEVQYASSLPSPTSFLQQNPHQLQELRLDCRVYDALPQTIAPFVGPLFPISLKKLSLTGKAFMGLHKLGSDWLAEIVLPHDFSLEISHLTLQQDHEERQSGPCSFSTFMQLLVALCPPHSLHLIAISLSYRPRKRRNVSRSFTLDTPCVYFRNVSAGFLTELFNSSYVFADFTTFVGCSIPRARGPLVGELELINIPRNEAPALPDQSLRNVLSMWEGNELLVRSCASFTDDTLGWLGTTNQANNMDTLHIFDCPNFTPIGVRHLMSVRAAYSVPHLPHFSSAVLRLHDIHVTGDVPALEEDDVQWFTRWLREDSTAENCVQWQTSDEEWKRRNPLDTPDNWILEFPLRS